jgi:stage II sporulation protein D
MLRGILVLALAAGLALAASAPATAATRYTVIGHGYGHGIGLSQYGALGFAQRGWSARAILRHYYRGTRLGRLTRPQRRVQRVLLVRGRSLQVLARSRLVVTDRRGGRRIVLRAGAYRVVRGRERGRLRIESRRNGRIVARRLSSRILLQPTARPLRVDSRTVHGWRWAHWRGGLAVRRRGNAVTTVNRVPLERYVASVVASEIPARWPRSALRAQAVAARSYAVATRRGGGFDAYPDTRDQVYGPIERERARASRAARATRSLVVRHRGRVAVTYFSSSSGGRTATPRSAWGSRVRVPYLRSVRDPYDRAGGANPNHTWRIVLRPRAAARALRTRAIGRFELRVWRPSRRVRAIVMRTPRGVVRRSAGEVYGSLGLRSTFFTIRRVTFDASRRARPGGRVRVRGAIRPRWRPRVTILARTPSRRGWRAVRTVRVARDGTFAARVRVRRTTLLRLDVRSAAAPWAIVRVRR